MASSFALRRAAASTLFNKFVNPLRSLSAVPRFFNTNAQSQMTTCDKVQQSLDVDRSSDRPVSHREDFVPSLFSSNVFDPFSPTRSLSQMLNLMDQFLENPSRGRGWDVSEDNEGLYLRMDMPGVDKDNVKVCVEHNTLVIRGEGEKDEEYRRRYSSRIDLPKSLYKLDDIKAEMKNGVLKIRVPKVSEEDREDVIRVQVE